MTETKCIICDNILNQSRYFKWIKNMASRMYKDNEYPIIPLSYAYGCDCNDCTHNICLINILECPKCQKKVDKPNLVVYVSIDKYINSFFDYIKENMHYIINSEKIFTSLLVFGLFLALLLNGEIDPKNESEKILQDFIDQIPKNILRYYGGFLLLYVITYAIIVNHLKKYYLYDDNKYKFY